MVQLGIVGAVLLTFGAGVYQFSKLESSVNLGFSSVEKRFERLDESVKEVKALLGKNTDQQVADGMSLVRMKAQLDAVEKRVSALEKTK